MGAVGEPHRRQRLDALLIAIRARQFEIQSPRPVLLPLPASARSYKFCYLSSTGHQSLVICASQPVVLVLATRVLACDP
jgi:hypothetical protein